MVWEVYDFENEVKRNGQPFIFKGIGSRRLGEKRKYTFLVRRLSNGGALIEAEDNDEAKNIYSGSKLSPTRELPDRCRRKSIFQEEKDQRLQLVEIHCVRYSIQCSIYLKPVVF